MMPSYDDVAFAPPAPVAKVLLRHPDHDRAAEAALLIDTGADVTLLPRTVVDSLMIGESAGRYTLVGFDGTQTEADAFRVDLVFLGRRFRGLYLVVDAGFGVLGRDVLNHLRLVLDGPSRRWDEAAAAIRPEP